MLKNVSDEKKCDDLAACTEKDLEAFDLDFASNPKNELAMNIVTHTEISSAALSRKARLTHDHVYSISIPEEVKPVTAQNSTGRCWLFAALNVMRIPFMKEHKLSEFQFSQSYLYFWDHFERCNYFLEQILDTLDSPLDGRLVQYLLSKPIEDGGQYDMIVNIIEKYGVIPRDCFPEVEATKSSRKLNWILCNKLREYAMILRTEYSKNKSNINKLREIKKKQLNEIWRIMCISFGKPNIKNIKWAFKNKDKEHKILTANNPLDFYNKYIRKYVNVSEQYSLINDPRNEYYKLYTVDRLNNIIGGEREKVLYINVPSNILKEYAIKELTAGNPVWFGCDVGKHFYRDDGVMDLNNFNYNLLLDIDFKMNKAERLQYGESLMTHAMVFTAVDLDKETNKPIKWRVENSWSDKRGHKGYCLMTDKWFDEYNYQLCVPKSILSKDILDILKQEPVVLPPWDPMGSLANISKL